MKKYVFLIAAWALLGDLSWGGPVTAAGATAREAAGEYGADVKSCDLGHALNYMYPPIRRMLADRLASRDPQKEAENYRRIVGMTGSQDGEGRFQRESSEAARRRMEENLQALKKEYDALGRRMRASGFKVERYVVEAPLAEYILTPAMNMLAQVSEDKEGSVRADRFEPEGNICRMVVLPTRLTYSMPDPSNGRRIRIERKGFIYAVRDEQPGGGQGRGSLPGKWYFIDGNTDVNTLRAYFPNLPLNIKQPDCGERPL